MRSLVLRVGEQHTLRLRGLGSAGYSWTWAVEGPAGVVAVSVRAASAPPKPEPGGAPPETYSADQIVTVSAHAPGKVRIELALRRVWETKEPIERLVLDVEVVA